MVLVNHKVLKNSSHGQIWFNFGKKILKTSGELDFFFKMSDKKKFTRQISVIPIPKSQKSVFDKFCSYIQESNK
jgi:hypothetical protein